MLCINDILFLCKAVYWETIFKGINYGILPLFNYQHNFKTM